MQDQQAKPISRFLTIDEVRAVAGGASKSTIYAWCRNNGFPKSHRLGPRRVGWLNSEVDAWVRSKVAA
ncbi:MAG: AlpA family phage regulatory protein [Hyphomicrobiaceae bacterium]|nr:AlpA family phage regulatory protein [Hyphomicrobiaceae bacterium]